MISLIIPLYNVGEYISDCLKSIENQIYKDIEVIIINDGSTDKSLMLVNEYIKKSNLNIILIEQQNSGVSSARNKGIELAKGDYICFIDADDIIYPDYLNIMLRTLEENKADVVFCKSENGHEALKYNEIDISERTEETCVLERDTKTALRDFLYGDLVSGACTMLVNSNILKRNQLEFREGYRYSEDLNFVWKVINKSSNIISINKVLYIYRTRNNSAMSKIDSRRLDGLKLMEELEIYFEKENPLFFREFKKYGVARWVWATLWQIVLGSKNYREFLENSRVLSTSKYFKRLIDFPCKKVQFSSMVYLISPYLYYLFVKIIIGRKVKRKFNMVN